MNTMHSSQNKSTRSEPPLKWSYSMPDINRPLLGCTVGELLQKAADKYGDEEAIISCQQDIKKTFRQFNEDAIEFAAGLLSLGFEPGDRLAMWGPNSYEWCITMFATAKAGLILVNLNPAYRTGELNYCLTKVGVRGIICATPFKTTNYYNILSDLVPEVKAAKPSTTISNKALPKLKYVITLDELEKNGAFNFKDVCNAGRIEDRNRLEELKSIIQFDDPYNLQFTSGTTGQSKAVVLTHFNLVNNAKFSGIRGGLDKNKERVALFVPLFHALGIEVGLILNVVHGAVSILPCAGFNPAAIMKSVKDDRVTSMVGTPTMYFDLLREYRRNPFEIKYLNKGLMTGSPGPELMAMSLMEELKMKNIIIGFGMTETGLTYLGFPSDPPSARCSTVGYPLDHVESKVVDKDGRIVPIGTPGELLIRGYCVFLEYWEDEEKTKEVLGKDRWMKTGDLAIMDENSYLKIVGRIKDMIIRGGENIYPAEIENFFLGHPDISEAQVFGVPDERMGEEVAMWIKTVAKNLTEGDVKKWAKDQVSHFKIPRYIMFVDNFPTTFSGKIKKLEMREETIKQLCLST